MGRREWFLHALYPEDSYSTVEKWLKEQQDKVDKARTMLQRVREQQSTRKNRHRLPASYQEDDWLLVHHSRLLAWPRPTGDDLYFAPYNILSVEDTASLCSVLPDYPGLWCAQPGEHRSAPTRGC